LGVAYHRIQEPERLHALVDAILLIETDASLSTLLSRIVETAVKLVGARYGALGVLAGNGESLSRFITYGIDDEERALIGESPKGEGLLGEVIRHAHPLRVEELKDHPSSSGFPPNHPPMHQFLGVPVATANGRVFGNLYLTDPIDGSAFSQSDEDLVEGFGRAAGIVIDQALLRSHARELTLSEERVRIARDLHDTVIQRLFGVGLSLQLSLSGDIPDSVRERIDTSLDDLNETIHEIRTTIFEINQEDEHQLTIERRIEALTNEVGSRLGVYAHVVVAPGMGDDVGMHCAQHALHALREMLSNVVRHSHATMVDVNVGVEGNMLVLTVKDNGVGFDQTSGAGSGLRNLRSRAHDLGGDCTIDTELGRGTLVRWTANRLD
jgi:signal transduction histidine kinase